MAVKRKRRTGVWISILLVLVLAAGAAASYLWYKAGLTPVSSSTETTAVEITDGESFDTLIADLKSKGLIKDELPAKIYSAVSKGHALYAGTFLLSPSMSVPDIFAYLSNPENIESSYAVITVPEGAWAKQIAQTLSEKIPRHTAQEYLDLWNNTDYINTLAQSYEFIHPDQLANDQFFVKLEGYLFPETYYMEYDMTPDQITRMMLDQFNTVYQKYKAQFESSPYTVEQLVTLASIVQFESGNAQDMKDIARVFYNRLDQGMKLQSSVTVCYALYDNFSSAEDCETNYDIDSPYNTYLYDGLPIGPILNPGEAAIQAVLEPADNDYLYFVADIHGDGSVHFARTYEEHQANIEQYNLSIDGQ